MIPGPVPLSDSAAEALAAPVQAHYGPAWVSVHDETLGLLRQGVGGPGGGPLLLALGGGGAGGGGGDGQFAGAGRDSVSRREWLLRPTARGHCARSRRGRGGSDGGVGRAA